MSSGPQMGEEEEGRGGRGAASVDFPASQRQLLTSHSPHTLAFLSLTPSMTSCDILFKALLLR